MTHQVYLYGVFSDPRPPVLVAVFSSWELAHAYVDKHHVEVLDGDGRYQGLRYDDLLDGFSQHQLREIPIDPV